MDSIKLTLDQIYRDGFNAVINKELTYGLNPAINPYPVGSIAWAAYELGMLEGEKEYERKLFLI